MGKTEYCQEFVKYELSEEEKRELASIMAMKLLEVDDIEAQKKSVMTTFKERIEAAQYSARTAAQQIKDGYEMRDVECRVEKDFIRGTIRYVRTDTFEEVRSKKMSQEEKQMHLDDALPSTMATKTKYDDPELQKRDSDIKKTQNLMAGEKGVAQ